MAEGREPRVSLRPDEVAQMRRQERRFGKQLLTGEGCPSGKRMWRSKAQAKRALKHAKAAQLSKGEIPVRAIYLCGRCDGWHLTKRPQQARRAA